MSTPAAAPPASTKTGAEDKAGAEEQGGGFKRVLDLIERVGNKVPNPAIMFLALCVAVIVLSQILYLVNAHITAEVVQPPAHSVQEEYVGGSVLPAEVLPSEQSPASSYHVVHETVRVQGLLTIPGIRYLFTSVISNFMGFTAMGIILVIMIGVGTAEIAGLISSLIRKLVARSPPWSLTYIIVFLGVISSIASDAGYLVLIPLGAVAFKSVGRHPLAGIAAAFAGVAGGFGVNVLITPLDAVLTEITNESIHLVEPGRSIDLVANLWFGIASTALITVLLTFVTTRLVEPRLGAYDPALAPSREGQPIDPDDTASISPQADARGLRWAGFGLLGVVVVILAVTLPPGAPLRDPMTGSVIGTSPFMDSLVVMISLAFFFAGLGYGLGARTLKNTDDVIAAITKSWAGLAGLLLLFLLIAQFIAYFNYSKMPEVAAAWLGDTIENSSVGGIWLLLAAIAITAVVNIIIPQAIAKWALLAPIFIPLFLRLGVGPATVLAAYRVGDSPGNIITPIMAYFPLIVVFAGRYDKRSGIGTVIALMVPAFVALTIVWTLFFVIWYLIGIPFGLGN
jgi:aminobenzoyl-glutamate transport protein